MSISRYDAAAISILIGAWIVAIIIGLAILAAKIWVIIMAYRWAVN